MKHYTHILFDLDGTITDPADGIVNSIQYAFEKSGIERQNRADLLSFIGPPLIDSFMNYLSCDRSKASQMVALYREYFAEKGMYENVPYSGMKELLEALSNAGIKLFVATSKPEIFAKQILQHFQLDHLFCIIRGSNLDGTMIEKEQIIASLIDQAHLDSAHTIMIGDRLYDFKGAQSHNMDAAAAAYGYGSDEEYLYPNIVFTAQSPAQLQEFLLS